MSTVPYPVAGVDDPRIWRRIAERSTVALATLQRDLDAERVHAAALRGVLSAVGLEESLRPETRDLILDVLRESR